MYDQDEQIMYRPGLQAVVTATAAVHRSEVLRVLDFDLHVLCEKPVSLVLASVRCHLCFGY